MTDDQLDEIRSRINPQYSGVRGTESFERKLLTDEILSNRAAIDELVGALKNVLPEVSVCGLTSQLEMIRALIDKHDHIAGAHRRGARDQHGVFD